MARALRAWAIIRKGKISVCNFQYGSRTRLVRGMSDQNKKSGYCTHIPRPSKHVLTVTPVIITLTTPTAQDATRLSLTPAFSSIDVE